MRPRHVALACLGRGVRIFVVPLAMAILAPGVARTACNDIDFGQLTTACGNGSAYCYVRSPGSNAAESVLGAFWALGSGNPVVGQGNDNGAWQPREQWIHGVASGVWLGGSWSSSPQIDGCIEGAIAPGETSEIMAVGLSDSDIFGSRAFFAAAAVARHPAGYSQFDFAGAIGRDIVLTQIPRPQFTISPTGVHFFPPSSPAIAQGFYSDGSATLSQAIVGYRIYRLTGSPVPLDRHRSAWAVFSPILGLSQEWASPECFCCGGDSRNSFVTALVFAGGFESDYVSQPGSADPCSLENVFDLDGDGYLGPEGGGGDCNDDDATIYPGSPEVNDGRDNQCPFWPGYGSIDEISGTSGFYHAGDKSKFTWWTQDGASLYELARSDRPDFSGSCTTATTPLTIWFDPEVPQSDEGFYYLVRAATPHAGSWGTDSEAVERTVDCP